MDAMLCIRCHWKYNGKLGALPASYPKKFYIVADVDDENRWQSVLAFLTLDEMI